MRPNDTNTAAGPSKSQAVSSKRNHARPKVKRVHNLIIVDESGSMHVIRQQAFTGMNETLQTIRQLQEKYPRQQQTVTLVTFSGYHTTLIYDNLKAFESRNLSHEQYKPHGTTPLYDAIGFGISRVQTRFHDGDHVLVTIITDGEENSSREWTLTKVRETIERLKQKKWTFTLIGTDDLDVESMAEDFAIQECRRFRRDVKGTRQMFDQYRYCLAEYNAFLHEEREIPKGKFFDKKKEADDDPTTIIF